MSGDDCSSDCSDWEVQSTGSGRTTDGGQSALEMVFRTLSSARRRKLLYYLREHDVATVVELARYLVASETDRALDDSEVVEATEEINEEALERATISLTHQHLPLLVEASAVDYDTRSETVRYSASPVLESFLTLAHEVEAAGGTDLGVDDENESEE